MALWQSVGRFAQWPRELAGQGVLLHWLPTVLWPMNSAQPLANGRGLNRPLDARWEKGKEGLSDLRAYLHSPKFNCGDRLDHYVNVSDVLAYLRNAEEAGLNAKENL